MTPDSQPSQVEPGPEKPKLEIDPSKLAAFRAQLERQQSLFMGILGGVGAAVVCAAVWAGVTVATKFQIGWMAVGLGVAVGFTVRALGKGVTKTFGVAGAILALAGCLLGNLLSACGFLAMEESLPYLRVVLASLLHPGLALKLLKAMFSPMDLLFYGIAALEGYKLSFREITEQEVLGLAKS